MRTRPNASPLPGPDPIQRSAWKGSSRKFAPDAGTWDHTYRWKGLTRFGKRVGKEKRTDGRT